MKRPTATTTPPTEATIHADWAGLGESLIRTRGLRFSLTTLQRIIPHGPYCYTSQGPLPAPKIGLRTRPCIFYRGKSQDDVCLINPAENFRTDSFFNIDQCKGCGINEDDDDCSD